MNTEHLLKLRRRSWHQPVWLGAAVLCVLSSFSLFWYFNVPIYDFVSLKAANQGSSQVVLIQLGADFSEEDAPRIVEELAKNSPAMIISLQHDPGPQDARHNAAVYIPLAFTSEDLLTRLPALGGPNQYFVLAPQDDYDGIVREFNALAYQKRNLTCAPCIATESIKSLEESAAQSEHFLIRYNQGDKSLLVLDFNQIAQGQIPANLLAGKILVVDALSNAFRPSYRTNLYLNQKISYAYYLSSVIDNMASSSGHHILKPWWLALLLFVVGAIFILILRNLSFTSGGVLLITVLTILVSINFLTIRYLGLFVPVFEFVLFSSGYIFYAIRRRDALVRSNINTSNTQLKLSLSETVDPGSQNETVICGSMYNFFGRVCDINTLIMFDVRQPSSAKRLVGLNEQVLSESELEKLASQISAADIKQAVQLGYSRESQGEVLAVPIRQKHKAMAVLLLDVERGDESIESILEKINILQSHYHEELFQEVSEWFATYNKSTRERIEKEYLHHGRLATLSYVNIQLVERILNQYQRIKSNYHRLNSSVIVYDIYGNLVSLNESAEEFAKKSKVAWYGASLRKILSQIIDLPDAEIRQVINEVLIQKHTRRFTISIGETDHHLATLSLRQLFKDTGNLKLVETTYITLEITDVSNIGTAAKLKHSYVNNLTHQIKQDLNSLSSLVDKLSLVDENTEKYNYLNEVIDRLNQRLHNSKHFIEDIAKIERSDVYSVDIKEKLDEALRKFEDAFGEKGVKLVYDSPAFLSHVVINYRDLDFVLSYLLELLLEDSLHNSRLEIRLKEIRENQRHLITLMIESHGYGLPRDLFEMSVGGSDNEQPINQCREFAAEHGGEFAITSTAGEGIKVTLQLPVDHAVH